MHEFVRYILPSLVFGLALGFSMVPAKFGQNMLWKKASQEGVTKTEAVALYIAMLIGTLLYLAAFLALMLAYFGFIGRDEFWAFLVWILTTVVTPFGAYKMKWIRPTPNSFRQFVDENPPAN